MIGLSYAGVPLNIATEEAAAWVREHLSLTDLFESSRRGWCQGFNLHPDALGFFSGGPVELNRLVWPSSCSRWAYGFFLASKARTQAVVELALPGGRPEAHPLVMSTRKDDGSPAAHTYSDQGSIVASMYLLPPRALSGLGDLYLLPLVDVRYMLWSEHTGQIAFDDVREAREENGVSYTYQTSDDQRRIIRSNVSAQTDSFPDPSGLDDGWSVLIDNTGGQLTLSMAPYALDGQSSVVVPSGRKVLVFSDGETYYTGWSWVYHLMAVAADVEIAHDAIDRDYLYPSSVVQNDCDPLPPWLDTVAWNVGQRIVVGLDGSITATNPPESVSRDAIDLGTHKLSGGKVLGLWSPQGKPIARSPESGLSVHPDFEYGYWTGTKTALEGTISPASLAGERGIAVLKSPVKSDTATTALASKWVSDFCKWQAGAYDVKYAGIRPVAPSGLYGTIIWTYHAEECSTRIQYADYPALEWPLHFFQEEDSWCAEFGLSPQLDACLPSRETPGRWCAEFGIPVALESVVRDVSSNHDGHWCAEFGIPVSTAGCFSTATGSGAGDYISGSGSPSGTPAAVGTRYFDTSSFRNWYKYGTGDTEWTLISGSSYDMLGVLVYARNATTGATTWNAAATYSWNTLGGSSYTVGLTAASDLVHVGVQALSTLSGIVTLDGNSTEEIRGSGGSGTNCQTYKMVANESLVIQGDGSHWRTTMEVMANFFFMVNKDDAQAIPDTTATKVQFDDEVWDRGAGGCYDAAVNYRYTPLAPGIYRFSAQVALDGLDDGSYGRLMIYKNGALHRVIDQQWNGAVGDMVLSGSCTVSMNGSTDYVEVFVEHNHGGDCNTTATAAENSFEGERLCRWES